jgi:hypothetical protein
MDSGKRTQKRPKDGAETLRERPRTGRGGVRSEAEVLKERAHREGIAEDG